MRGGGRQRLRRHLERSEPLALLSEVARQVSLQDAAWNDALAGFRADLRDSMAGVARERPELFATFRQIVRARITPDHRAFLKRRFSAQRLAKHRASLGLSAQDYGRLVGVSGQSIYKWEAGDVRPRATQIEALASVRALGKRAAAARLAEITTATAKPADRPARNRAKRARNTK